MNTFDKRLVCALQSHSCKIMFRLEFLLAYFTKSYI